MVQDFSLNLVRICHKRLIFEVMKYQEDSIPFLPSPSKIRNVVIIQDINITLKKVMDMRQNSQ